MSARVVVTNLRKGYGQVQAVRGITFAIQEGEIFGLLGPNGAGKTSTVECLLGLREPDEGQIQICGLDARRHPQAVKQRIGAALQTTSLQDKITPREALWLFGAFYADTADPAALLDRFSLTEKADVPYETLSGGQRQRLAIALAFINKPELVFLDEPTTGLDPESRRELHAEIRRMKEDGRTVLLTTHHLEEAEALCDRIAIIVRGQIIATGAPADLIAHSTSSQSVSLTTASPVPDGLWSGLAGVADLTQEDLTVRFRTTTANRTLAALLQQLETAGIEVTELVVRKASLEDVYLQLTHDALAEGARA